MIISFSFLFGLIVILSPSSLSRTTIRHRTTHNIIVSAAMATSSSSSSVKKKKAYYDLLVVGGGSAGLTAAKFAGRTLSKSVCIIEQSKLGGDCTWTGCVPSKSLLASSKAAQLVRKQLLNTNKSNISVVQQQEDFAKIQQRYRQHQKKIYEADDSPEALSKFDVDTINGKATLIGPKTIKVTTVTTEDNNDGGTTTTTTTSTPQEEYEYTAKFGIVLCTGATPKELFDDSKTTSKIPGGLMKDIDYVTYETIWDIKELPRQLTIVGGGPIGCEFAQAFARLGSQVTIIADRLLPREEPEVSEILSDIFINDENITILKGKLESVQQKKPSNTHTAKTTTGCTVTGDCLLLAVGRTPNTKGLGLDNVGIKLNERNGISVNDKLQTSVSTIYAAGDCTGDRQFTHYAGYQGAIACRNLLLPLSDPGVLTEIPATTFTSPEIASVGLKESEAKLKFGSKSIRVSSVKLEHVDRAICEGQTKGILKVIYEKRKGAILGATMMCPAGGELISEISVAMKAGMAFEDLAKVIHPYPSYAIALQQMAADVYYAKTKKSVPLYNVLKKLGL